MELKPIVLVILFVVSGVFYYNFTDASVGREICFVEEVVDGDTLRLEDGRKVRLIGINTPESSMAFNEEATGFLRDAVEGKLVEVESYGVGKYGRTLAYVFLDDVNMNGAILSRGLGTLYYYERDGYYDELARAEEFARLNGKEIWGRSGDYGCLSLVELKTDELEKLVLRNDCDVDLEIMFKDDATHIYWEVVPIGSYFEKTFSHIWNDAGDSLYVWDEKGLLVFYRY